MIGFSSHVEFNIDSAQEIQQNSHLRIVSKQLYEAGSRKQVRNGVLDRRMGVCSKDGDCETCGKGLNECIGHFGYLDLALPVFHVGHFRATISILQTVCKSCSKVLLKNTDKVTYTTKLLHKNLSYLVKRACYKQILDKAKKQRKCPHCLAPNGVVKKGPGLLKILHNPAKVNKDEIFMDNLSVMLSATQNNQDLNQVLSTHNQVDELNPLIVLEILKSIPKSDVVLLGLTGEDADPSKLILTRIYVPPVCIRPSVVSEVKNGT